MLQFVVRFRLKRCRLVQFLRFRRVLGLVSWSRASLWSTVLAGCAAFPPPFCDSLCLSASLLIPLGFFLCLA